MIELVPLHPAHRAAVTELFHATQLLGEALPFPLAGGERFAALALGWYFGDGLVDGLVAVGADGSVVGYCLVCADPHGHERWLQMHTARAVLALAGTGVRGRLDAPSRRFYRLRLRDAWHLARSRRDLRVGGHAHVNLAPEVRDGRIARRFRDHVDDRCRAAGLDGWYAEINARPGRRAAALGRVAGTVVSREPNRTLSAYLGEAVTRLTVWREVPTLAACAATSPSCAVSSPQPPPRRSRPPRASTSAR